MRKLVILSVFCFGVLLTAPLFSAGGGDDEGPGGCQVTINGNQIFNNENELVGCVRGGSNCTYTIDIPCN